MQYGYRSCSARGFSWKYGITKLLSRSSTSSPLGLCLAVCPSRVLAMQPTGLNADPCPALGLSLSVPAHFNAIPCSAGILTCLPSPTPRGLGLGTDLPMGGLSFPRKPWAYGDQISHLVYRYSCLHKLFPSPLPVLSVRRVSAWQCSSTALFRKPVASVLTFSPVIFSAQTRLTSELLRFL